MTQKQVNVIFISALGPKKQNYLRSCVQKYIINRMYVMNATAFILEIDKKISISLNSLICFLLQKTEFGVTLSLQLEYKLNYCKKRL
jgi:hypothetical protein